MSKRDKLIRRFMALDPNIRGAEVIKLMKWLGYEGKFPSGGSSHCTFRKEGEMPITIPMHEPISVTYIKLIRDLIQKGEKKDEE